MPGHLAGTREPGDSQAVGFLSMEFLWSLLTETLEVEAQGLSAQQGGAERDPPDASGPRAPAKEGGYAGGLWPPSSCVWSEGQPGPEALWPQVGSARPLSQAVSSRL